MRILTLCEGGNVRSVSAAYLLKNHMGHDALAVSVRFNTPDTLGMLYRWSEKIIAMYLDAARAVPTEWQTKLCLLDVGADRFGTALHPDLLGIIGPRLGRWFALGNPSGVKDGQLVSL